MSQIDMCRFISFNGDLIWAYRGNEYSRFLRFDDSSKQVFMPVKPGDVVSFMLMNRSTFQRGYSVRFGDMSLWPDNPEIPDKEETRPLYHVVAGTAVSFRHWIAENGALLDLLKAEIGKSIQISTRLALPNGRKPMLPYGLKKKRTQRPGPDVTRYLPSATKYPTIMFMDMDEATRHVDGAFERQEDRSLTWNPESPIWWVERNIKIKGCERFA